MTCGHSRHIRAFHPRAKAAQLDFCSGRKNPRDSDYLGARSYHRHALSKHGFRLHKLVRLLGFCGKRTATYSATTNTDNCHSFIVVRSSLHRGPDILGKVP